LGRILTGTRGLTADYPAALAFENNGVTTYVVYNFKDMSLSVNFSDGQTVDAQPSGFTVITN
jgi:hypothetical protein